MFSKASSLHLEHESVCVDKDVGWDEDDEEDEEDNSNDNIKSWFN